MVFLTGNITKAVNSNLCQEAARSLKTTLFVIGESGQDDKHTKFLGKMPYQKVLKNLPQFGIGLAFYTKEEPWTTYCDPVKVRDYLACGLPVVVNQVPPVAKDIAKYQAGEIANDNVKSIASACKKIQQNYQTYSKNALKMARDFNSHPIICQALEKL